MRRCVAAPRVIIGVSNFAIDALPPALQYWARFVMKPFESAVQGSTVVAGELCIRACTPADVHAVVRAAQQLNWLPGLHDAHIYSPSGRDFFVSALKRDGSADAATLSKSDSIVSMISCMRWPAAADCGAVGLAFLGEECPAEGSGDKI